MKNIGIFSCITTFDNYEYIYLMIDYIRSKVSKLILVCDEVAYQKFCAQYANSDTRIVLGHKNHALNYGVGILEMQKLLKDKAEAVVLANSDILGPVNDLSRFWNRLNSIDDELVCVLPSIFKYEFIQYAFCGMSYHSAERFASRIGKSASNMNESMWKKYVQETFGRIISLYSLEAQIEILEYKSVLEKYSLPFVPISLLLLDYDYVINNSMGNCLREVCNYLKKNKSYNIEIIWDILIKERNIAEIIKLLHLNFAIPTEYSCNNQINTTAVAIVVHIYYADLIDDMITLCAELLPCFDFFFTTDTLEKRRIIEERIKHLDSKFVEIRLVENRGRDVSSLLVGVKDIVHKYKYICFVHDKKTSYVGKKIEGEGFAEKCIKNVLYNKAFCENVIDLFEKNPRLGIAFPPEPNHASFFSVLGNEWSYNYEITKEIAKKLCLERYLNEKKEAIAPLGTCFWFRTEALEQLFQMDWKYEDFPPEPNGIDGTVLHACERIYAYVAQGRGYYPAYIMADKYFAIEYTNLHHYVRCYNSNMLRLGISGKPQEVVKCIVAQEGGTRIADLEAQNNALREYVEYLEKDVIPGMSIKNRIKRLLHKQ